ncbi:hypothetical protein [Lagierella sp.]|uniref:hypothetical protein n=1 Tax=Lagierella sp. TaxID=2849657 RepID=UPI002637F981|nr:hypothetical protein [Lagierella sp.]
MKVRRIKLIIPFSLFLFLVYVGVGAYKINKKYPDYIRENYKIGDKFTFGQNENISIIATDMRFEDFSSDAEDQQGLNKVLLIDFEFENKSNREIGFTPMILSIRNNKGYINGVPYEIVRTYNEKEELDKFSKQRMVPNSKAKLTLPFFTGYNKSEELKTDELENYYIVISQYPRYQRLFLRR